MNVIFDTNIFRQDLGFKSSHWEPLFNYLKRTRSEVVMPQIVWQELSSVYRKELESLQNDIGTFQKRAGKLLLNESVCFPAIDVDAEVQAYLAKVQSKLNFSDNDIVPYKGEYIKDIVYRAIERVKPCSEEGEEFRDAILWLTVKEVAHADGNWQVAFISNNTNEFAGKNKSLHPTLLAEAELEQLTVHYYTSIFAFLSSHSHKVEGISKEWILKCQSIELLNEDVMCFVESDNPDRINEIAYQKGLHPTGNFEVTSVEVGLDDFYIDDRDNESKLVIDALYSGEAEILIEAVELEARSNTALLTYETVTKKVPVRIPVEANVELVASYPINASIPLQGEKNKEWSDLLEFADVHVIDVTF